MKRRVSIEGARAINLGGLYFLIAALYYQFTKAYSDDTVLPEIGVTTYFISLFLEPWC
jgi:hypothetical protein